MGALNYHHLFCFWSVARKGGITLASHELRISKSALSTQIRALEDNLGEKLFIRRGRNLVLTDAGRVALRYADEIFLLGKELREIVGGGFGERPLRLLVGVADVLAKPIVRLLLDPVLRMGRPVQLVCREDRSVEEFIGELSSHALDLVLSDSPAAPSIKVRAFNHLLGECGTTFFASPEVAGAYRRGFPGSLDGAPLLLPGSKYSIRRSIDQWLSAQGIRPAIMAEFDDAALMNLFGADGVGVFPAPTIVEPELVSRHGAKVVGRVRSLRHQFYAISVERKMQHPAVIAICEGARHTVFGGSAWRDTGA